MKNEYICIPLVATRGGIYREFNMCTSSHFKTKDQMTSLLNALRTTPFDHFTTTEHIFLACDVLKSVQLC